MIFINNSLQLTLIRRIQGSVDVGNYAMLLGLNNISITNDNAKCSGNGNYSVYISISKCKSNEFNCNDGLCVAMSKLCDGSNHCEDGSDEDNCQVLSHIPKNMAMTSGENIVNIEVSIDVTRYGFYFIYKADK